MSVRWEFDMKIGADFTPDEDLIVTVVNGLVLTPPVMLKKDQPVRLSLSGHFPKLDLPPMLELEGYLVRPVSD